MRALKMGSEWEYYTRGEILPVEPDGHEFVVKVADTIITPSCTNVSKYGSIKVSFYYHGTYFVGYKFTVDARRKRCSKYAIFASNGRKLVKRVNTIYGDDYIRVLTSDAGDTLLVLL